MNAQEVVEAVLSSFNDPVTVLAEQSGGWTLAFSELGTEIRLGRSPDYGNVESIYVFTPVVQNVPDTALEISTLGLFNTAGILNRFVRFDDGLVGLCFRLVAVDDWSPEMLTLFSFCLQEQVSSARAKLFAGIAEHLRGEPALCVDEQGEYSCGDIHQAVHFLENVVRPQADEQSRWEHGWLSSAREQMKPDMPLVGPGWVARSSPGGVVGQLPYDDVTHEFGALEILATKDVSFADGRMASFIVDTATRHPYAGRGAYLHMHIPMPGSAPHVIDQAAAQLNRRGLSNGWYSHAIGAWTGNDGRLLYQLFLPNALWEVETHTPLQHELLCHLAREAQEVRVDLEGTSRPLEQIVQSFTPD